MIALILVIVIVVVVLYASNKETYKYGWDQLVEDVYIINLEKDTVRKEHMKTILDKSSIPHKFWKGYDARKRLTTVVGSIIKDYLETRLSNLL